jgi:hypothetical protein
LIPCLVLFLAAISSVLGADARAQRKEAAGAAPPQPVPLAVKVRRGGKTEIPLRIYGQAHEPLKFLIRAAPAHGRISEPRQTEREAAVVVYEPPADVKITIDKFSYAVQGGVGVSAAVDVVIMLLDEPPQLVIPDALDFPAVPAGGTSTALLEISNRGGGVATGEVILDRQWRIDGNRNYRIAAGDVAVFKIIFAPASGGTFDGVARFSSDPEHSTKLHGESASSITASPARVTLENEVGDPVRTGAFELANLTNEPRVLQLKADARLQLPPQVTLPARGKITVPIQTDAVDVQALDADIHIEAEGFELIVPVKAPKLGPILRTTPSAIAMGRLKTGQAASARFGLENIGGLPSEATWEISAPFRVAQNSSILLPGEKRSFPLEIETKTPGRYRTWLQIKAGGQSVDLPVQAEVIEPPHKLSESTASKPAPDSPTPAPTDSPMPEPSDVSSETKAPNMSLEWASDLTVPRGVKVAATSTKATVEWAASMSSATRFRLELRDLGTDAAGNLQVIWRAPTPVPIERRGNTFVATLDGLESGQPWTARILPIDANGTPGRRLFAVNFDTPPKASLLPKISLFGTLFWVLCALLGWQFFTYWRDRKYRPGL